MGRAGEFERLLDFPAQWYFMQIGPWMGPAGYLFNGTQLLIVAAAFLIWGRKLLALGR